MNTKVIKIKERDAEALYQAGQVLKQGGLVAFPTETVYGLGGDALNPDSSRKIYAAKGRPSDNPLIVHIADMEALDSIVTEVTPEAKLIAKAFWPGPMTIVLPKKEEVPSRLLREYDLYNLKYELPELKISETELTIFIDTLESWLRPLIQAQRIYAYSSDYFKYLYSKGLLNYWDEITIEEIINHLYFLEKDDISLEQIKELQTLLRENLENSKKNSLNK